jgi:hypothetical protein
VKEIPVSAPAGTLRYAPTPLGVGLYTDTNTVASLTLNEDWLAPFTVVVQLFNFSVDNPWGGLFTKLASTGIPQLGLQRENATDNWRAYTAQSGSMLLTSSSIAAGVGVPITYALTLNGSGISATLKYFRNGALIQSVVTTQPQNSGIGNLLLSAESSASASYGSDTIWYNFYRFNRVLSVEEMFQLGNNPSAKLRMPRQILLPNGVAIVKPTLTAAFANSITTSTVMPQVTFTRP